MLEGIEILNQTPIMTESNLAQNLYCSALIMLIILMISFIIAIIALRYNKILLFKIMAVATIIIEINMLINVIIGCCIPDEPTEKYEYQVTIDESVPFTDLYNSYEIINQEGKIYTIREKD